jgi:hypothetical protein
VVSLAICAPAAGAWHPAHQESLVTLSDAESVMLPVYCTKCGGAVTLFLTPSSPAEPARTQTWKCSHCHEANAPELSGKVGWVAARQRD